MSPPERRERDFRADDREPEESGPEPTWATTSELLARVDASKRGSMTIYSLYIFDRHCTAIYYQDWHRSPLKPARPGTSVLPSVSPAVSPLPSSSNSPTAGFDAERQAASTGKLPFRNTTGIDLGGESSPTSSTGAGSATRSGTGEQSLNAPLSVAGWKEAQEREARERARLEEERRVGGRGLPFDEEAKLVYGVVFSLRNMVKKLSTVSPSPPGAGEEAGGEKEKDRDRGPLAMDEQLIGYSTPTYSLHLLRTPSGVSFVLLSSPVHESLRYVLQSIWKGAWVDFVVRNPLVSLDSAVSGKGVDNELFRRAVDAFIRGLPVFN